jgi:hypothetical protein
MDIYQNCAHIIGVDKRHTFNLTTPAFDGIAATAYDGKNWPNGFDPGGAIDPKFSAHVDTAYHLGVPVFALIRLFQDTFQAWINDPSWGFGAAGPGEWNSKVLTHAVRVGNTNKKIAGVIIDARGVKFENGNVITQTNWVRSVSWFCNGVIHNLGLGIYLIMDQATINKMPPDGQNSVADFVSKLDCHADIKVANFASTKDAHGLPYPDNNWKPDYLGNVHRAYLSYYGDFALSGVSGGKVDLIQYDKTPLAMNAELGFTGSVVPPIVTPPVVDPSNLTDSQKLEAIYQGLKKNNLL